jgi:uncharacterized protein (DUF2344 family)
MSIGLASDCEFLDLRLVSEVDTDRLREAFNASLTDELQAVEAYLPESKFTDIAYSSYRIEIVTEKASEALAARAEALLTGGNVVVFKRSKSGDKDTDISSGIHSVKVRYADGALVMDTVLKADNAGFLNPEYLVTYLKDKLALPEGNLLKERYTVLRTGLYLADMTPFR